MRREVGFVDHETVGVEAGVALDTAQPVVVAVDLEEVRLAGLPVQIVDVLGDERVAASAGLEGREGLVPEVGLRGFEGLVQPHGPALARIQPFAPRLDGVS